MVSDGEYKKTKKPEDHAIKLPAWAPANSKLSEDGKTLTFPERPGKYHLGNKLNDRTNKEWLQFQKSWFVLNPKPRKEEVLLHPAKFPEELVRDFVSFYTKPGELVLDPLAGTGSTLVGALQAGRSAVGVELQAKYAEIASQRVAELKRDHPEMDDLVAGIHNHDARRLDELDLPVVDYVFTSPPYWDMLREPGFETQRERTAAGLDVAYSEDEADVGNIKDYEAFLESLVEIYRQVHKVLKPGGYLTVVVKNVKKGPKMYPLAWDLGRRLGEIYTLKDERIWCLPPDEIIITDHGPKRIEEIMVNEKVLSHRGKMERVTATMKRAYSGDLIGIKPALLLKPVHLTPEHEVLEIQRKKYFHKNGKPFFENFSRSYNRGPQWIASGKLKIGDAIAFPIHRENRKISSINVYPYLPRPEDWYTEGDWYYTKWRGERGRGKIPKTIPLDRAFLRLSGWFLSEGSSSTSGIHIANTNKQVREEVVDLFQNVFQVKARPDARGVWCRSRTLARLMANFYGKGAVNKRLPSFIWRLDSEQHRHLLQTLWLGDGHIGKDGRVTYKTISPELAFGIVFLTSKQGAIPYIQHRDDGINLVYRGSSASTMKDVLGLPSEKPRHIRSQHWLRDDVFWLPIRDIQRISYKGQVFNLEVENSNSFTTKGFVVHNCQDNQRLAPYGYRYAWVSNTFHHYCLNFRKSEAH